MDKKKLIGTIIGVTMFAALIAGATFAWLSISASVGTPVFNNATSRNFIINYAGDTALNANLTQIKSGGATTSAITSAASAAVAGDGWAAVTASKTANSAKASSFKVQASLTTNTMTTNSIGYAVCKGACSTTTVLATFSGTGTGVTATCGTGITACGTIPAGTTGTVTLYNDTSTFNTVSAVSTTTYNVYFWANADTITNGDLGKKITGYVFAEATQG